MLRNGNEVQKGRPALVISDDNVKRRYNDVTLAAITSQVPVDIMALELIVEPEKELAHYKMVMFSKIADFGYYRKQMQSGLIKKVMEGLDIG